MERADRVGGKNGNTVALLQNMECPDVDEKMSFQNSDYAQKNVLKLTGVVKRRAACV